MTIKECAHPHCKCLDYCENQDPYSKGYPNIMDIQKQINSMIGGKRGECLVSQSDQFDMDVYLYINPHPVSLLLRSASYEDCEACEQDPYIEIPLDQFNDFLNLLKDIEYQLNAIQDSRGQS